VYIGDRPVGDGEPCYVVAEAGVNHDGRLDRAMRLVEAAADAGADAVKFQKRTVRDLLVREALSRPYDSPQALGATYGEHRERLELSEEAYRALIALARRRGIALFASAWDVGSADFLCDAGVPAVKIASADVTNLPLVEHIARRKVPVIVSTGMSTMDEIADAVAAVRVYHDALILLQCTSLYPCESDEVHLRVMARLRRAFRVPVGYSGHERGLAVTGAAVALGAVLVERHLTLDRTARGPDHAASLEPDDFRRLVRDIRDIEAALGSPRKRVLPREWPVRRRLGKSVVAACPIPAGATITRAMLAVKGPGTGISPRLLGRLVGTVAPWDIPADTVIASALLAPRPDPAQAPSSFRDAK
jgi:sialic acid synthase SpsE